MDLFTERKAAPMLIARQTEAFDSKDWIYELKLDGFRCLAYLEMDGADLRNKRNMKILSKFPELADIWKNVSGRCILDGEVVVLRNGIPDFYLLQRRTLLTDRFKIELESTRYPASFVAFDCLYQKNQEQIWKPLMERKRQLSQLVSESPRMAVSRYLEENGIALYQAAEEKQLEGVVAKRKDSSYLMGKRTKDWVKFKRMADEEFVAAGFIQKGQYTYSIILAKYRDEGLVYKGYVTAGVTEDAVRSLRVSGKCPFMLFPLGNERAVWVYPERVCSVEYMPNTKNALRQPVFKGFRDDILPTEVKI